MLSNQTVIDLLEMLERCAWKLENASAELSDPRDSDEEFQELAREVRSLVRTVREAAQARSSIGEDGSTGGCVPS